MVDAFTKRNHYNPCFWTAYWNPNYYSTATSGMNHNLSPRDQEVLALNIRADKIVPTVVGNIHFDKDLGVAEITQEAALNFCKRWFPLEYEKFSEDIAAHPKTVYMDFEDILSGLETLPAYSTLIKIINQGRLTSPQDRGFLSCFIVLQALRSHEVMNSMIESSESLGLKKFEYFWFLKNALSNPYVLARAVIPLAVSEWILYSVGSHTFPLCDSPVLIGRTSVMVTLSPRILLEVNLNVSAPQGIIQKSSISRNKIQEFQRRSIQNAFKDVIFHDRSELESWQRSPEFRARTSVLTNPGGYRSAVAEAANRVIWAVNGFGRLGQDFDELMKRVFNE